MQVFVTEEALNDRNYCQVTTIGIYFTLQPFIWIAWSLKKLVSELAMNKCLFFGRDPGYWKTIDKYVK